MGQLVIWPWPWWECLGFPSGSMVKESAFNAGDVGLIPELGRSPGGGHGNPLQYSCLENPMDRGTWWATVQGVAKSRTRLSDLAHTHGGSVYTMGTSTRHTSEPPSPSSSPSQTWSTYSTSLGLGAQRRHSLCGHVVFRRRLTSLRLLWVIYTTAQCGIWLRIPGFCWKGCRNRSTRLDWMHSTSEHAMKSVKCKAHRRN